jgi:hypothetical protein
MYRWGVHHRPLLLALSVGLAGVGIGACTLDLAGLAAPPNGAGAGGSSSVTSASSASGSGVVTASASSAGSGGAGGATTTAQSASATGGESSASSSASASASVSSSSSSSSSSASSSASTGGGTTTCDSQYGGVAGYQLCAAKPTTCEFNVDLNQSTSCGAVCGAVGGACVLTLDNGTACEYLGPTQDCAFTGYGNAVCVCSLGCGVGPPCDTNKACTGGICL